jgi:hypothetical protein
LKKLPWIALIAGVAYWVMSRGKSHEHEYEIAAASSDTSPSEG